MSTEKQPHIKTKQELTKLFNEYTPHEIQIIEVALSKDEFSEFQQIGSLTNTILEVYPIIEKNDKVTEDIRQLLHGDIKIEFISHIDDESMFQNIYEHVRKNIKNYTKLLDPISKNKLEILKLYMKIITYPEFEQTLHADITLQLHLLEQLYEYENLTHSNNSYFTKLLLTVKKLKKQIQIFNISNEVSTIKTDFDALTAILNEYKVKIKKIEDYYFKIIEYIIEYIKQNRSIFVTNPKTVKETVTKALVKLDQHTSREAKPGVFYGEYKPSVESNITNNDLNEFYLKCINFKVLYDGLLSLEYAYNAVTQISTTTQPFTTPSIHTPVDKDFPDLDPIDDFPDLDPIDDEKGGKKKRSSSKKHKKSRKPHRGIKKSRRYKRATRN